MGETKIYKKLEMELKRNSNKIFTPWQIQEFIAKLASTYYKLDLINSISNRLNLEVKQEQIFIIDESFKYNNRYKFLEKSDKLNLNNEKEFKNFYHFGNPISMFSSSIIMNLNLKFKLFRDLNKYLGNKQIEKIDKSAFHETIFDNSDIKGNKIFNLALQNLKSIDKPKQERFKNDLVDIKEKYEKLFDEYKNNELSIDLFKSNIRSNEFKQESLNKFEGIEYKYFKKFTRYFNRLERPIVGIYLPETNTVELLGSSFINKQSRDERFLDIKEISHNSPPYSHLFIGLAFAAPIVIMIKNIIESNKKKILNSKNQEKINELEEKNKNYYKSIEELELLIEEETLKKHKDISNEYTQNNMQQIYNEVIKKTTKNIKDCGFENNNLSSNVIEFEKYKK